MSKPEKTILILGAGVMQLPAIRIAKELNWRVIVADANETSVGVELADIFLHVDLKDREAMAEAASSFRDRGELDGVFTAGTDFSATVAWVAQELSLPGLPYEVAMQATDKSLMRAAFKRAGVPSPEFRMVRSADEVTGRGFDLPFPVVVKPVDNMGARGIRRVDSAEDLPAAVDEALSLSRTGKAIVEEYVEGPEFSIDAVVENGKVIICGVADRKIVFPPYFVEMGHTIPTASRKETLDKVVAAFERGVHALGITNGAAKGDVKLASKGPVIGEIAARLSGGYMSGWTYPFSSGVRPTEGAMRIAVGLPAGDLSPVWNRVSAERAFLSIPGVVSRISGFEQGRQLPSIKEGFLRVTVGDRVRFPTNNVEKCGNFISQAGSRSEAVSAAEEACRAMLITLDPGDGETEAFLFHGADPWAPSAFRVEDRALLRRLDELPPIVVNRSGPTARISVAPLAGIEAVDALDWHGGTLTQSLQRFQAETGVPFDDEGDIILGRLFWQALLRGGLQGAIWLVETVHLGVSKEGRVERMAQSWST